MSFKKFTRTHPADITQLALPALALGGMHSQSTWTMATSTLPLVVSVITLGLAWFGQVSAFVPTPATTSCRLQIRREVRSTAVVGVNRVCQQQERCGASAASTVTMAGDGVAEAKSKILQLAAVMDRGGMANPGVSSAYLGTKDDMRRLVDTLAELDPLDKPLTATELSGRWELAYTTVELFRASPFFQMVEAGYDNPEKSNLFFKLHQLQTGSWGASSIGRITQTLDLIDSVPRSVESSGGEESAAAEGEGEGKGEGSATALEATSGGGSGSLESEVDLIILPLTSVPLVGFWKLLPTFGGCIATRASCVLSGDNNEVVELTVESTKLKAVEDVPLLPLAGSFFEGKDFPTGDAAKMVMGNVPVTKQTVAYVDGGMRVMRDKAGELYIYVRPLESY